MRALHTAIDFVARSSTPLLVSGETGVGKDLVARAIHARSARRDRPFVAVNSSAILDELLLFGPAPGGVTGVEQGRRGLLMEADGGTLLLDEIGDMSFGLQAELLRVLQLGDVRPVRSDGLHPVDVRIIASSHCDLPDLVKRGRFREDLFVRLSVLSVHVPALRDHREDIPALVAYFLAEACRRVPQSPVRSIGRDAIELLGGWSWPGNVRELESRIERAVVFGLDERIDPHHLESDPAPASPGLSWPVPAGAPWTLHRLSHAYMEWVLAQSGGNKERAAECLGIDLSTLYRWQRAKKD